MLVTSTFHLPPPCVEQEGEYNSVKHWVDLPPEGTGLQLYDAVRTKLNIPASESFVLTHNHTTIDVSTPAGSILQLYSSSP